MEYGNHTAFSAINRKTIFGNLFYKIAGDVQYGCNVVWWTMAGLALKNRETCV
jgi:hypothetical protein